MIYQLHDFIFNTQQRTLSKDGLTLLLTPKTYKLMLLFIEADGRVVSKDEIRTRVWRGQVVCETTLYKVVQRLRTLFGDDGEEQAVIKTIHGEGYLMVAKAKRLGFFGQLLKNLA